MLMSRVWLTHPVILRRADRVIVNVILRRAHSIVVNVGGLLGSRAPAGADAHMNMALSRGGHDVPL